MIMKIVRYTKIDESEAIKMGLFDLFVNKEELCKTDNCIKKAMDFIKIICSYDGLDCPLFSITFGNDSISFYFFDSDNSTPCIYMNMIHRKQAEEEELNLQIGKAIHADELPKGTKIEWHFDDEKNAYDYYVLRHSIVTEHKKCGEIYLGFVKTMCQKRGLPFEIRGNTLHIKLK